MGRYRVIWVLLCVVLASIPLAFAADITIGLASSAVTNRSGCTRVLDPHGETLVWEFAADANGAASVITGYVHGVPSSVSLAPLDQDASWSNTCTLTVTPMVPRTNNFLKLSYFPITVVSTDGAGAMMIPMDMMSVNVSLSCPYEMTITGCNTGVLGVVQLVTRY